MREIKFRVWNKQYKHKDGPLGKMEYGLEVGKNSIFHDGILMQFTGLLDKNDKEIYEGDLLGGDGHKTYRVDYSAPSFFMVNVKDYYDWSPRFSQVLEIIGNIYENSNLINNYEK